MPNVIVAGSINMDLVANVARIPMAGETIAGQRLSYLPGGKGANQAVAAARAGAQTLLCGAVGDDLLANELLEFLEANQVDISQVTQKTAHSSGTALITVADSGQNTIVYVAGANQLLTVADTANLSIEKGDIIVCQCETPLETTGALFERAALRGATCILNPSPVQEIAPELLQHIDFLVVNEVELGQLTQTPLVNDSPDSLFISAMQALQRRGLKGAIITTLGSRGLLALTTDGQTIHLDGHTVNAIDTTGAGDCFLGCLAAELSAGTGLEAALKFANAGAALSVQKPGAGPSMPLRDEIINQLQRSTH